MCRGVGSGGQGVCVWEGGGVKWSGRGGGKMFERGRVPERG